MTERADIDWFEYLGSHPPGRDVSRMHWHGFTWAGDAAKVERIMYQAERTYGTQAFAMSDLPPDMTGWWLHKPRLVRGTWTTSAAAAAWMREQWDAHPPDVTHLDPANRQQYAEVTLGNGKDDVWAWRPTPGHHTKRFVVVVCCQTQETFPDIPCPAPPK